MLLRNVLEVSLKCSQGLQERLLQLQSFRFFPFLYPSVTLQSTTGVSQGSAFPESCEPSSSLARHRPHND